MERAIDAGKLLANIKHNAPFVYSIVAPIVAITPTLDVAPVRHGRWEYRSDGWYCTACNKRAMVDAIGFAKYCYRCGTKMDGDERD